MPDRIGRVLSDVLKDAAARHQPIHQLQAQWVRVVGRRLAAHTKPGSLRRQVLYVQTDDPGASFEWSLEKQALLSKIRVAAGCEVTDVVVRPGVVAG